MKISKLLLSTAALACAPFTLAQETQNVPAPEKSVPEAPAAETTKITIEIPKINLPKVNNVEITPTAMVQIQYAYATNSHTAAKDRNSFAVRRTTLGATAKTDDGWSFKLVYEFDSTGNGGDGWNDYIDTAVISKKTDAGTLTVGHKKSHFGLEEYSPSSQFLCIERSLNSNFLNTTYAKGLSGYHCGVEWAGKIDDSDYGVSLTNAVAKDYNNKSNDLALTYWLGHNFKFAKDCSLYAGLNGTVNFGNEKNATDNEDKKLSNAGTVYGLEPYLQYKNGGLTLMAIGFYINGEHDAANIGNPNISRVEFYGLNLTAAYKLDCGLEPAMRFTYLHTNSGLINASTQNRVPANDGGNNDLAYTMFAGANYYFNKNVKLAAGWEYGHLYGGARDHDFNALRTMLQMRF